MTNWHLLATPEECMEISRQEIKPLPKKKISPFLDIENRGLCVYSKEDLALIKKVAFPFINPERK
jgi:hypothetical protein